MLEIDSIHCLAHDEDITIRVDNPVGHWYVAPNIAFPTYGKPPGWWTKFWTARLLGWKWVKRVDN